MQAKCVIRQKKDRKQDIFELRLLGINLYGKPSSSTEAYILFESMGDVIRNVRTARDVHAAKEGGGETGM